MTAPLPPIPVLDLTEGGPVRHAAEQREAALALRAACLSFLPPPLRAGAGAGDALARRWLTRSASPYVAEVAEVARIVGAPGVWAINTSYEWGCTARAAPDPATGTPRLRRTLDWPFPGLGRGVQVARQRGAGGDWWNVTWPGAVGALTGLAPGRFGATINQAPLRRAWTHPWLRPLDLGANALNTYRRVRAMPASHLLRLAFETARDFAEARDLLARTPVARPVLFALAGARPGEALLIERTEDEARIAEGPVTVANDWQEARPGWEERMTGAASMASRVRIAALSSADGAPGLDWLAPPVLNGFTRLAVEMSPAAGRLAVQGFEPSRTGPAAPATARLDLAAEGALAA